MCVSRGCWDWRCCITSCPELASWFPCFLLYAPQPLVDFGGYAGIKLIGRLHGWIKWPRTGRWGPFLLDTVPSFAGDHCRANCNGTVDLLGQTKHPFRQYARKVARVVGVSVYPTNVILWEWVVWHLVCIIGCRFFRSRTIAPLPRNQTVDDGPQPAHFTV